MSLIEWRKEFEIGRPEVDAEHRELVALINELPGVLQGGPSEQALEVLGEIYASIAAHFALEERLMRDNNYDDYAAHKQEHESLLDELLDLMDDFDSGAWVDINAFAARVGEWFSEHFRNRDARLHRRLG